MQTIQTENAELDNKVVIMTYGMEQDLQILRDIANQDGGRYGVSQTSDVTVSTTTVFTAQSMAQDEEKFRLPIRIRTLNLPIYWLRDFSRGNITFIVTGGPTYLARAMYAVLKEILNILIIYPSV